MDSRTDEGIYRRAFESSSVGLALLGLDGRIQHVNRTLEQMLGRSESDLLGASLETLLHPRDRHAVLRAFDRARRQHEEIEYGEIRLAAPEVDRHWVHLGLQVIHDDAGSPSHCMIRLQPSPRSRQRAEQIYLLSYALDYTADGVLLLDDQQRVRYLNEAACRLSGQTRQRLLGQPLSAVLAPVAGQLTDLADDECLEEDQETQRVFSCELTVPGEDAPRYVTIQFNHLRYDQRRYSLALIHDFSEQRHIAGTLRRNERQLRALIENTPDAIGRLTPDFRLIYANPALEALCRLPLVEARGRPAREAFGDNSQVDIMADLVREVASTGESMQEELIHGIDGPTDQQTHYLIQLVPERDAQGEVTSVISIARDISGIRKAERRLAASNRQLLELSSRRESAREEERKLIAQEIHDELGQHLTALRMGISLLRLKHGEQAPGLGDGVESLMALCDRTIGVVRYIATSLRPAALNMGLYPALEWLINEFRSHHTHIACELLAHSGAPALDDSQATTAFRIVQEALTNIARHSGASRAVISLERADDRYVLDITDNGHGFDPAKVGRHSLGLAGMRERGASLGGEVVIFSHPAHGTTVQATFPVNEPTETV
ncbi:PAS domain-containing sensor histidine kinase [Pseudomonas vanderleydeniana]|uniref:PAS domain-containing protein n=1 Tax=Pseudomonas vanderleydeniana TaxID=2745495 RepID=A0A9E6TVC5_9PSED|nr:PAS domain-containing sensor histidine kinase [Pseudomonas vanderleydeniana]QXI31170.1 PAS domain-containing protein [Pseudomonas vanderleydeniana]